MANNRNLRGDKRPINEGVLDTANSFVYSPDGSKVESASLNDEQFTITGGEVSLAESIVSSGVDPITRAELLLNFESASRLTTAGTSDVEITDRGLRLKDTTQGITYGLNSGQFVTPEIFSVDLESDSLGTSGTAVIGWGATNSPAPGSVAAVLGADFVGVRWNGTTWQTITTDGASVTANTITNGSFSRITVEYTGTSWKFYQDGTLIAEHTTNLPDITNLWAPFTFALTRTSGSPYMTVGRYYARWQFDA